MVIARRPSHMPPHSGDMTVGDNGMGPKTGLTTPVKASESRSLENETKDLLNRVGGAPHRCATYEPTLKELSSVPFSDYVRGALLGVPLPGWEDCNVPQGAGGDATKKGTEKQRGNVASSGAATFQTAPDVVPPSDSTQPLKVRDESITGLHQNSQFVEVSATATEPEKLKKPLTTIESSVRTRSQLRVASNNRKVKDAETYPQQTPPLRNMQMCPYKLRGGIAKVKLPLGFWSRSGIGSDVTARGRQWAKGSKLGDIVIQAPIKQCIFGIGGVYEYTLIEQSPITVSDFRTEADNYRKRQIGKELDEDTTDESIDDLARKFWRRLGPTMEAAVYGADMEGSLFNGASACGWNVDRLESCLQLLRADAQRGDMDDEIFHLPGVTSAYLYFGMWASAFAAHTEDMNLLSINLLHAGAPKYWYAISPKDSPRFENLARSHFPGQASECQEFLRHKSCLLSPATLRKAGINFTTCIQRPGDAIITFPGSYHFGFNTGFNIAESTNFAVPEWIPIGEAANFCMCVPHSVRIQMGRLKILLEGYEKDMLSRSMKGLSNLSYSSWAKLEAKKKKKAFKTIQTQSGTNSVENADSFESLDLPTSFNTGIPVEVTTGFLTQKKKGRKSLKRKEVDEWRLAVRARPRVFVPNAHVICLVKCGELRGSIKMKKLICKEFEFFIGTVVKLVDDHVKVHFTGLNRKEDMWYTQDNSHLFLDGGTTESPDLIDENKPFGISREKKRK